MPIRIIDNISDYNVSYTLSKQFNNSMDSVDLLFEKGLLKTTKNNDCKFLFPIFKPYSILTRLVIYGLMDYRELANENEFKVYEFVDWLSADKRYRNYLILVWITKKLKEHHKDSYFFNRTCKYPIEAKKQIQESNLKDFNCFDLLNLDEYKKSTLKKFTMNKTKIRKALYLLSNSVILDIFDKQSTTDNTLIDVENLTDNIKTYEVIKLNKAFFKIERRVKLDNWLF